MAGHKSLISNQLVLLLILPHWMGANTAYYPPAPRKNVHFRMQERKAEKAPKTALWVTIYAIKHSGRCAATNRVIS